MAKKMWMVTEGDYSDYKVICVCSSKKKARNGMVGGPVYIGAPGGVLAP